MQRARVVLWIADGAGRQLARLSVSGRTAAAVGFCGLSLVLAFLAAGWHLVRCWPQRATAHRLQAECAALREEVQALQAGVPPVQESLLDNRAVLAELERKSGFTFVALADAAEPAAEPSGPVGPVTAEALAEVRARGDRLQTWLGGLSEYWHDAERRLANTPAIRPARTAWLSSSFGVRIDPIHHYTVMHKGLDLAGFIGMLVYAPADGRVIWTGLRGSYGQVVVLDHGWGLQTHFAHLSRALVTRGDSVRRGEPIAEMGNTGKSTGPHLHYEVRQDGYPIDPRNFILD